MNRNAETCGKFTRKCAYVATISSTESRYKRMYPYDITVGSQIYHQDPFVLKLSADHLEHMDNQFIKILVEKNLLRSWMQL